MNRRQFLASIGAMGVAAGCRWGGRAASAMPPGDLGGSDNLHGHRLRGGGFPEPSSERHVEVAIVGGGIAGLSCAWRLRRRGFSDFALFELESSTGGNSRDGVGSICRHPLGAHYLPIPGQELSDVRELLAELGVLKGDPRAERPLYDEAYVCAAPQERLFADGL